MQTNLNVMATKKYSLAIEKIDEVAKEFIAARPAYTLHIKECNQGKQKQIEIINIKNQEKSTLNCFITGGQVSHNIQGKKWNFEWNLQGLLGVYCGTDCDTGYGSKMLQIERCKER